MFTEAEWKKVRPSSGKDSGIAGALELWEKHCKSDPAKAASYDEIGQAIKACTELGKAFVTAIQNMSGDKKADEAIRLIKGSTTELTNFKKSCETAIDNGRKLAEQKVADAEKVATDGKQEIDRFFTFANAQKDRIAEMAKTLGDTPKSLGQDVVKKAQGELARWKNSLVELAKQIAEKATAVKNDKAVSHWRLQGAEKICRECKIPPTDAAKFAGRFQQFTQLLTDVDKTSKAAGELADKQGLIVTGLLASCNQYLNATGAQVAVYKELLVAIENRHKDIKNITLKNPIVGNYGGDASSVDKLYKEQKLAGVQKQKHGCQSQIDQIVEKIKRLEDYKVSFKSLIDDVVKKTSVEDKKNEFVKPLFEQALKRRTDVVAEIDKWTLEGGKVVEKLKEYLKLVSNSKYK